MVILMDSTAIIEITQLFKSISQSAIYIISTNLLYPVIIILLGLIIWSIIEIGSFLSEYKTRHRDLWLIENGALKARRLMLAGDFENAIATLKNFFSNRLLYDYINSLSRFQSELHDKKFIQIRTEKLLQEYDGRIIKKLERSKFVTKAAPMFGLMGTLIPMGPALLGLAQGDIKTLSDNLIIAFGTTVVGLMAGVMGYLIFTVRSRWYTLDMGDMEYISEILFGDSIEEVPDIPVRIKEHTGTFSQTEGFGVVKVISRFIHFDLFFTPTSIIVARTAGSILTHPVIFLFLLGIVNAIIIIAHLAGLIVVPIHLYLIFINLLVLILFMVLGYVTKNRAIKRSREIGMLPFDNIIKNDPHNIEVKYSDILEVNISRSLIKILTTNGWIVMGRLLSYDHIDIIQAPPLKVTIGDKI
jgi:biopolymer transport protein ExbB/TolQ